MFGEKWDKTHEISLAKCYTSTTKFPQLVLSLATFLETCIMHQQRLC